MIIYIDTDTSAIVAYNAQIIMGLFICDFIDGILCR